MRTGNVLVLPALRRVTDVLVATTTIFGNTVIATANMGPMTAGQLVLVTIALRFTKLVVSEAVFAEINFSGNGTILFGGVTALPRWSRSSVIVGDTIASTVTAFGLVTASGTVMDLRMLANGGAGSGASFIGGFNWIDVIAITR